MSAFIIKEKHHCTEEGSGKFFRNVGTCVIKYKAVCPKGPYTLDFTTVRKVN
jgi:hypothetical protein